MKKIIFLFFFLITFKLAVHSQIQNVIVEKYYVSDTLDATDTTNWTTDTTGISMKFLPVGSITYRVYVQLDSGYKIKRIYGTPCNPLKIVSTANFFNNIDRPAAYFGALINKSWFGSNPTLALDSWLTLGLCAKNSSGSVRYKGVLKTDDTDGSIIGGTHNGGGTLPIVGGIIRNEDASAGIPVDTADGMEINTSTYTLFTWNGITTSPTGGTDTTVFGNVNTGSQFISTNGYIEESTGATGDSLKGNKVLVAQLTTTGDITFELNLELINPLGAIVNVVSHDCGTPVTGDTIVNGLLKYPPDVPVCGCPDPNYIEYNPNAVCSSVDSCHNRIIFGCMDSLACNYDPMANYNIQSLCCYPGNCNDRDISLVCPSISGEGGFEIFPNPVHDELTVNFSSGNNNPTKYAIYDSYGIAVIQKDLGNRTGSVSEKVDVSILQTGIYLVRVFIGNTTKNKTFMKN